MDLKVNLDPNEVNVQIAKIVVESSIGIHIKAAIEKNMKSLLEGYQNPIELAIKDIVLEIVKDEVRKKESLIRETVSRGLTEKMVTSVMVKFEKYLGEKFY